MLSYRYVAFKETVNAVVDDILRNYALYAVVRREHARARDRLASLCPVKRFYAPIDDKSRW